MQSPLHRNPTRDELQWAVKKFNNWMIESGPAAMSEAVGRIQDGDDDPEIYLFMSTADQWAGALMKEVVEYQQLGVSTVMSGFLMRIFWTGILLGVEMHRKDSEWMKEFAGK